jgi:hypothetical protein
MPATPATARYSRGYRIGRAAKIAADTSKRRSSIFGLEANAAASPMARAIRNQFAAQPILAKRMASASTIRLLSHHAVLGIR